MLVKIKSTGEMTIVDRVTSKWYRANGEIYSDDEFEVVTWWTLLKKFFAEFGWLSHAR